MSAVVLAAEINRIASVAAGSSRELMHLWDPLREILPFSAAWLGVLNAGDRRFLTAAATGRDPPALAHIESPAYYAEVESYGIWRHRRPICLRTREQLPACPSWDRLWWPAGQHDGFAVPLITVDGRPVGLLVLLTDSTGHAQDAGCQVIESMAPMIAAAIDPMTSIAGLAGLVVDAYASAAVGPGGTVQPLPGSRPHPLLTNGSRLITIASDRLRAQGSPNAFLYPYPRFEGDDYLRVTVIGCPPARTSPFSELVILSPPADLHGLTRRELEVLGLLIDGATNREIAATLFITQRTVAAHLEHVRSKLDLPTRTAAAVRSLNQALYVPPQLGTQD